MKKVFLLLLVLTLVGCGSASETTTSNTNDRVFRVGDVSWKINLSPAWKDVSQVSHTNKIFLAENGLENLSVVFGDLSADEKNSLIFENVLQYFPAATLVDQGNNTMHFRARQSTEVPVREFYQRIVRFGQRFLLGSCSGPVGAETQCEAILDSIQKLDKDS